MTTAFRSVFITALVFWTALATAQVQPQFPAHVRETIFIHFDQNTYLTGETCWFRIYLRQADSRTDNNSSRPSSLSKVVYLELIDFTGQPAIQQKIKIENGVGDGSIYLPIALSSGNYAVRAYTNWMRNFSPSDWFHHQLPVINPFVGGSSTTSPAILRRDDIKDGNINTQVIELALPSSVGVRSEVKWSLKLTGIDMPAQLSMSIYRIDSLEQHNDIALNHARPTAPVASNFLAETAGPVVEVESTSTDGTTIPDKLPVYFSIKGSSERLYGSKVTNSRTRFSLPSVYGDADVIIQSPIGITTYDHRIVSGFSDEKLLYTSPALMLKPAWSDDIIQRSTYMQVRNIFDISDRRNRSTARDFYDQPDERYVLDEFTRFPLMEEVFREIIKSVQLRERRDEVHLTTINSATKAFFNEEALILLDGTPLFDATKLMMVDPLLIESVDVVTSRYVLGPMVFNGIIHLKSYKRDMVIDQVPVTKFRGLLLSPSFTTPDYSRPIPATQPDFRQLMHWHTFDVGKGGYSGMFYSSDLTGIYRVVVIGITHDGVVLRRASTISVAK